MSTYRIVRMYFDENIDSYTIDTGLSLEEAQEHCRRPETSSSTGGIDLTTDLPWFDGYEEE